MLRMKVHENGPRWRGRGTSAYVHAVPYSYVARGYGAYYYALRHGSPVERTIHVPRPA